MLLCVGIFQIYKDYAQRKCQSDSCNFTETLTYAGKTVVKMTERKREKEDQENNVQK